MKAMAKNNNERRHLPLLLCVMLGLGGCSSGDFNDLQAFVDEVRSRPAGPPEALPEFKTYETYAYSVGARRDPFSVTVSEEMISPDTPGLRPQERHPEALEQFPLDTLRYVGSMEQEGAGWAIITAPDGIVHRVRVGNYLGQNHGQITKVSEGRIDIEEIVPDGIGGWMKRNATLSISE